MELKHESITLSSLVRRALNPTCSILICFSREGGGVLAPGFLRSLYRRVQGILRSLISLPPLSGCFESFSYSGQSEVRSGMMTTCCVVNGNMDQSGDPGNQYCMTKHGSSYPPIVYCLRVSGVWNYPMDERI